MAASLPINWQMLRISCFTDSPEFSGRMWVKARQMQAALRCRFLVGTFLLDKFIEVTTPPKGQAA
jgi:hypothetical protein